MRREFAPLTADGFFVHVVAGDGVTNVVVSGELDLTTCEALQQHVAALVDGSKPVVIDLRDVSFMDSTGLRALWTIKQHLMSQGSTLALKSPSRAVGRVLEITHLDVAFDVIGDVIGDRSA